MARTQTRTYWPTGAYRNATSNKGSFTVLAGITHPTKSAPRRTFVFGYALDKDIILGGFHNPKDAAPVAEAEVDTLDEYATKFDGGFYVRMAKEYTGAELADMLDAAADRSALPAKMYYSRTNLASELRAR